jgi:hypothetical protein
MKPLYKHDCDQCHFLGAVDDHDLYFCNKHMELIARFGNDPPDYRSGHAFIEHSYVLGVAKILAIQKGLLKQ